VVIEETWTFDQEAGAILREHRLPVFYLPTTGDPAGDDSRALLAAQAPAMARLLLKYHHAQDATESLDPDSVRDLLREAGVLP
jgi:hypothetical protein